MDPSRPRRGPYRRYLRDFSAPVPKTTRWRLKKNEELKTTEDNEASLFEKADENLDISSPIHDHSPSDDDEDESAYDRLTAAEVEVEEAVDNGDIREVDSDVDEPDDSSDIEDESDFVEEPEDDQHGIGDLEDQEDESDFVEEPEDDQHGVSDLEDQEDFVEEPEDDQHEVSDLEDQEDESDDEDAEIDEKMFEPVYGGARITVCGAYCAIMEFKRVCRLPFTAIAMLLQVLQLLCPANNKLPRTVFILKKFFQKYSSKSRKMRFCGSCNRKCSNPDCQSEPSTLIILRPDKAIRRVLTKNQVTHNYPQSDMNNIYYDIHSGKGFRTRHPEQFGIFFNTDGISPFKSSRLTIWPIYLASPVNVVLIKPFHLTNKSILSTSGNPGRDILSQYAEVDLLSSFVIQVKKQLLPLVAVPIADILFKCKSVWQ